MTTTPTDINGLLKRLNFGYLSIDNANKDALEAAQALVAMRDERDRLRNDDSRAATAIEHFQKETQAAQADMAALRAVLKKHHKWHQDIGVVHFQDDDDSSRYHEVDLSDGYADSSLADETTAALSTPHPGQPLLDRGKSDE